MLTTNIITQLLIPRRQCDVSVALKPANVKTQKKIPHFKVSNGTPNIAPEHWNTATGKC